MNLPILKRNFGGTVSVPDSGLVTAYLGADPGGRVKKVLIKNTHATDDIYVTMNTQGGTYNNLDYATTLDKRLIGRLQPGYAALPAPGDVADIYNDFGGDVGDFTVHLLKTRGREDDYVMIGEVAGTDPARPGYIEESGGDWRVYVTGCTTIPHTTGYIADPKRYFQVDAIWVEANGMLIPADTERELTSFIWTTDQPGIETITISNPAAGTEAISVLIESVNH